jgi:hypothetical protein
MGRTIHESTWRTADDRQQVVWNMPAHVESGDTRTLRIRIDAWPAETDYWYESTDDTSLFATDAALLMNRFVGTRRVRIEFTPFQSSPQVATFEVRGFAGRLQTLRKAGCEDAIAAAAVRAETVAKQTAAEAALMWPSSASRDCCGLRGDGARGRHRRNTIREVPTS